MLHHIRRVEAYQRLLLLGTGRWLRRRDDGLLRADFLGIAGLPMRRAGWVVYGTGMLRYHRGARLGSPD